MHVKGFATDVGGRTSHTAIVARAMGIPAVVGLGDITGEVSGGDTVIIDGNRGVVIINPDDEQLAEHREIERKQLALRNRAGDARAICPRRRSTATSSACRRTSNSPRRSTTPSPAAPRASGCIAPNFSTSPARHEPTEEDHYAAYAEALRRLQGQAAGHPHARSGRRQIHAGQGRQPRAQSVPRRSLDPHVPARHPDVQAAASRDHAGQRARRCAHHVPDDQHADGASAGQDGAERCDGGAGGRGHRIPPGYPDRHHDRSAVGGADGRSISPRK